MRWLVIKSLEADGFPLNATEQSDTPAELARLPNKESLLKDLAGEIQDDKLTSVLFIDLDNFKLVNDEHGHSEGDNCLVEIVAKVGAAISGKENCIESVETSSVLGCPIFPASKLPPPLNG